MIRTLATHAINYLKYFLVFIAALAIPALLANSIGTTAALGLMAVTCYFAAKYGHRTVLE